MRKTLRRVKPLERDIQAGVIELLLLMPEVAWAHKVPVGEWVIVRPYKNISVRTQLMFAAKAGYIQESQIGYIQGAPVGVLDTVLQLTGIGTHCELEVKQPGGKPRGKETFGKAPEQCISEKTKLFKHKRVETLPATDTLVAEGRNKYRVRIGILPFRSLGLPDSDAVDGWGRLLQYAVTEKLTDSASFDQKAGAIDVIGEAGQSRLTPSSTAQYVVFSTGEDGKGAYSADGVFRGDPCPVDVLETENCNGDAVFMDAQSQFAPGPGRGGGMVVSYDDYIAYKQYDVDLTGRGGLLYYYRKSCLAGFTENRGEKPYCIRRQNAQNRAARPG